VSDDETFVSLLNSDTEIRATLINLVIPGYSTDQEYLLFRQTGKSINVDSVLLLVFQATTCSTTGSRTRYGQTTPNHTSASTRQGT